LTRADVGTIQQIVDMQVLTNVIRHELRRKLFRNQHAGPAAAPPASLQA
jgi:hypothetical protein